ncbi:GGDEF domain-containing protein [Reinekea thalattae]|uniref:diguanylate cyclase n=1 Tax=Reinekea thalattae TaxID=2593301 RepID=A0A5C8ZCC1_9GAMM|nr:GGDEF domain-containing protein [Reinekea thalattae]TXR54821.1 GGDEF domain-containing protein [Reinekea thalattae]
MKQLNTDFSMQANTIIDASRTAVIQFNQQHQLIAASELALFWLGSNQSQRVLDDQWLRERSLYLYDRDYQSISIEAVLEQSLEEPYLGISLHQNSCWVRTKLLVDDQDSNIKTLLLTEVTELVEELMVFRQQASNANTLDLTTSLYNRRHAIQQLHELYNSTKKINATFSVALIGIDHFKRINDTYGHDLGDAVLARVAQIIKQNFNKETICARYGNQEFLVLLPNTNSHQALVKVNQVRQLIFELKWNQFPQPITISAGIVEWEPNKSVEQLVFMSDQRLVTAQKAGRNQVCGALP